MKYMKHLIEADDANEIRVQNDFFMTSGSLDTVRHFLNGRSRDFIKSAITLEHFIFRPSFYCDYESS